VSLKAGTTNYEDYAKQPAASSLPAAGIIRTWIGSSGIINFFAETGSTLKAIFGVQADYNDAISKKHANTLDHTQGSDGGLAAGADWDVTATADTAYGALKITVTGQSSTTIRWVAFVELIEVAF